MADCDLCGVGRPTLCPVKVHDPRVKTQYPAGTWRNLSEECLNSCYEANVSKIPSDAKKCDLCGTRDEAMYRVEVSVPTFGEPYSRAETRAICESCLAACEESYNRRQAEKEEGHHH